MPKLTYLPTGETYEVPAGQSFLDLCQEKDIPHPFGCTVGSCGTCRLVLEEGAGNIQPLNDEERETVEMSTDVEGARLGCQMKIQGDVAVRPVD